MSITQAIIASGGQPPPYFQIDSMNFYVDEGGSYSIYFSWRNYPYTTIYYSLTNGTTSDADFTFGLPSGSLGIQGSGSTSITYSVLADHLTEGQEYFYLHIGTSPGAGDLYGATIYINDTSLTPPSPKRIANFDGYTYSGTGAWYDDLNVHYIDNTHLTWNSSDKSFTPTTAIDSDNSNDYLSASPNPSVALWVKWTTVPNGGDHALVTGMNGGSNVWQFRIDTGSTLNMVKWGLADQAVVWGGLLQANTWYHVVAAVDNTETRYYINGLKVATYTNNATMTDIPGHIQINQTGNFQGRMGKIQVYNYALSDLAVQGLYDSECVDYGLSSTIAPTLVRSDTDLKAVIDPMFYNLSGPVLDITSNHNDMTVTNTGNSITYTRANRGIFRSNAASATDTVKMSADFSIGTYTVLSASRLNGGRSGRILSADNNWLMGSWSSYENAAYFGDSNWVYPTGGNFSSDNVPDTKWRIHVGTMDTTGGHYKYYVNGVKKADNSYGSSGPTNLQMFTTSINALEYSAGDHGVLLVWNRVLTDSEVAQAYEYFRTRYAL